MRWLVYSWCAARGECSANAAKYKSKRRRLREEIIDAPTGNQAVAIFRDHNPDQKNQFVDFERVDDLEEESEE